jgi:hypothetical protein
MVLSRVGFLIGASGGGGPNSESGASVLVTKWFNINILQMRILCSGGLEPAFRVLFFAIFHEFRSGISMRWKSVERSGIKIVVFL